MPLTSANFPNGLLAHGYMVSGSPVFTSGKIFYVCSVHPNAQDDPAHGKSKDKPFATMDYATGRCTASNGDVVIVMPGHVETVIAAGGLDLDVAGVTYYGMGTGSNRPKVNFTTAVGADMDVDAANITMVNFLFTGGFDALTGPLDINAADCRLIHIETRDVTGQATDFIVTDANADRLLISGWTHRGSADAGPETAITIVGGDDITIQDFWIDGNFSVAAIENVTTPAVNLTVGGGTGANYARTRNAADVIFTADTTTSGNVGPNIYMRLQDNAANVTEALVGAAMQFFSPLLIVNTDGEQGLTWNGPATIDI